MMCVGWLTVSGHRVLYRFFIGVAATICCFALQVSAGETLRSFSPAAYVGWGMEVPDQYRADFILRELREFESRGEFPQLVFICQVDRAPEDARAGDTAADDQDVPLPVDLFPYFFTPTFFPHG